MYINVYIIIYILHAFVDILDSYLICIKVLSPVNLSSFK